jgi:PEGA domain-containing protein
MTRVLSSACMVLLLLVMGGKAWAGGKAPIAILGLEVYDNGGGIDPETTKAAKELTAALRDRARAGTGPYVPVAAEKELIDEKLLNNCDSESPQCMAAIGTELGAEALMYGKIERSAQATPATYKVSIKLLNVNRKQLASSIVETLPFSESTGVRVSTHAKAWYGKLVGITTGGTVVIKANIDRGTVMIDDDVKGNLASGVLTLSSVAEGRHTLAIEAKDYQRYETSITVRNGETLPHTATLVEMGKKSGAPAGEPPSVGRTVASESGPSIWKPVFYGSAVVAAGAIGFTIFEWRKGVAAGDDIPVTEVPMDRRLSESDCPGATSQLKKACGYYRNQKIGWAVTSVAGVAVIGSFFMAFIRDREHTETQTASGGHRKRRELAITPVLTPDGAGATLRLDW